ncbi:MAG: hypothetical protein IKJ36_07235 [Clostridia bacterium]|nr:hypothetical protein [Clostridia bacterium]
MLVSDLSILQNVELYILLFFVYSFLGWFMESIGGIFVVKKYVNRGFLIGPYCPVYGTGVVLITLLLNNSTDNCISLFINVMVICGVLEYLTGYLMEKIFKARWWDYSDNRFNINGRVCLETLVPFSIMGTLFLYVINPILINLFVSAPDILIHIITWVLFFIIIIDTIFSLIIMNAFKNVTYNKKEDNTEEISKRNQEIAEYAFMKLESEVRHRSRKLKLKTLRKVRYRRNRIKSAVIKELKELSDRLEIEKKKSQDRINLIQEKISTLDDEFKKAKEIFKSKNIFNKRLLNAFPNVQLIKKNKKK